MDASTVRVNAALLPQFQGRLVRLIGRVTSVNGRDAACVTGPDNVSASLVLPPTLDVDVQAGQAYEVVGKVGESDAAVRVLSVIAMGDIDLAVSDKLVGYVHKVPELFH